MLGLVLGSVLGLAFGFGLSLGLGLGSVQCVILIEVAVNPTKTKDYQFCWVLFSKIAFSPKRVLMLENVVLSPSVSSFLVL